MKLSHLPYFFIALALGLTSCATAQLPKRMTSDDCLVLIKTTIENADGVANLRRYYFALSTGQKVQAATKNGDYTALLIREPGIQIVGLMSDVDNAKATGDSFSVPLNMSLPYKPGEIVAADFAFVETLVKAGENTVKSSYLFSKIGDDERNDLVARARELKAATTWNELP